MKLEDKFFYSFFYPFLISMFLSSAIVTIFLGIYTNSYNDRRTTSNILDLEYKISKININSLNEILTSRLLKVQAGLNEQILSLSIISNKGEAYLDIDAVNITISYNFPNFLRKF